MATAQQPLSPEVHHLGRKPVELEADALVPAPAMPSLALQRAPEIVLQEAAKAAQALRDVIEHKPNKCVIGGRTYLQFEDWQTLGRFYGITVAARSTTYIEYGRVQGFEAHAEAILVSTGQVISAAQAMCLDDEDRWSTRPVYEYQNNRRVKVGDEKVPLFQLRSMAQTRAQAKALRNVLAWVVVMAGYQPTPAEEMDGAAAGDRPHTSTATTPAAAQTSKARIPAATVAERRTAILTAENFAVLDKAFRTAYGEASAASDQNAQGVYIAAKDQRRGELRRGHNGL